MPTPTIRMTLALPADLLAAVDQAGHARSRNELWLGSINKIGKESLQPGFYQAKITAFFYLASQAKP